jgi:hypothetical protein
LSEGWESGLVTDEGWPLTRFGCLTVTINFGSEFGLIPKNSRWRSRSEGIDLNLTRQSLGNIINDILGSIISWITEW